MLQLHLNIRCEIEGHNSIGILSQNATLRGKSDYFGQEMRVLQCCTLATFVV